MRQYREGQSVLVKSVEAWDGDIPKQRSTIEHVHPNGKEFGILVNYVCMEEKVLVYFGASEFAVL